MLHAFDASNRQTSAQQLLADASGYIFDMDDLLVRSKAIWREAIDGLLMDAGLPVEAVEHLNYRGLSAIDTVRLIHQTLGVTQELEAFQRSFVEHLLRVAERRPAVALPGAIDALRHASKRGPVAVASGSPLELIHCVLGQLAVIDDVTVLLSSDEVEAGKPQPDVFLEAARIMKLDPASCVVFEDSIVGVQAARAAGIPCIAVPSESPKLIRRLTPYTYQSLTDVPWPT
jgi:HAD superfamily hydrolase (TIGR01509 family)